MPFNPSLPADAALIVADELRDQFNGLKSLIDAIPPGATVDQLNDAVAALSTDINTVAAQLNGLAIKPSAVDGLGMVVNDPPTTAEVQQIADKLDELLAVLKG